MVSPTALPAAGRVRAAGQATVGLSWEVSAKWVRVFCVSLPKELGFSLGREEIDAQEMTLK